MTPFFFPNADLSAMKLADELDRRQWADAEDPEVVDFERAELFEHWKLFDTLMARHATWVSYDSLPLVSNGTRSIAIPFSYYLHSEQIVGELTLEEWLTRFLNAFLPGRKYLFSCDPQVFYAVSMERFGYDHLDLGVDLHGENSNFVLFSQDKRRWALFHGLFPFVTLSMQGNQNWAPDNADTETFLQTGFEMNFEAAFAQRSESFKRFFEQTYAPRLENCRWLLV